ncbi:MAG: protein kinase [bacterium]|nr:protein kinase [bacterium]
MEVGHEVGHYRVIEHIGRGGMADVWSARDRRLNRTVAIKTIARNLASEIDPVKLFEREARTIAALEHPHILPIYDFGEHLGQLYIVMRYVSGGSVEDLLDQRGRLSIDEVLRLARPIAQALDYAHANNVIHLDLKPSNILLDSYHAPYLADFGLASVIGPEGRAANPGSGTLLYMAPEQLTAADLDRRADVFSYCVLLYHMITGQLPFDTSLPIAIKQLQEPEAELPDLAAHLAEVAPDITTILRHGTRFKLEDRAPAIMTIFNAFESAITGLRAASTASVRQSVSAAGVATQNPATRKRPDMTTDLDVDMMPTQSFDQAVFDSRVEMGKTIDLKSQPLELPSKPIAPKAPSNVPKAKPSPNTTYPLPGGSAVPADEDAQTINFGTAKFGTAPVIAAQPTAELDSAVRAAPAAPALPADVDPAARAEAILIYTQARRAWANGQGRFLIGLTPFMLIHDFYSRAGEYALELDDAGRQMFLRGALEYDFEVEFWWAQLNDENRRWVALHTLRSQNPPAQIRALRHICVLDDAETPQIPKALASLIRNETNDEVRREAIRTLEARGQVSVIRTPLQVRLDEPETTRGACWNALAFSPEIDMTLGRAALDAGDPETAEIAARAIGRIRSSVAVNQIGQHDQSPEQRAAARRALALIRDEAPMLPTEVQPRERFAAWLTNTVRRVRHQPSDALVRFLLATLGAWIGMAVYIWIVTPALPFLDPNRIGLTISVGLSFAVFFGLQVVLASELPGRLRGFWRWWGRGIAAFGIGLVIATFSWAAFTWLYLQYPPEGNIVAVGIGTALALAISVMIRLPAWVNVLLLTAGLFIPIQDAWTNQRPPILYVQPDQDAALIFLIVLLIISIGAYAPQLWALGTRAAQRTRSKRR